MAAHRKTEEKDTIHQVRRCRLLAHFIAFQRSFALSFVCSAHGERSTKLRSFEIFGEILSTHASLSSRWSGRLYERRRLNIFSVVHFICAKGESFISHTYNIPEIM